MKRARDLDEGRIAFIKVPLQDVAQYQDKLIYTTGPVSTANPLMDPIFGVTAPQLLAQPSSLLALSKCTNGKKADKPRNARQTMGQLSERRHIRTIDCGRRQLSTPIIFTDRQTTWAKASLIQTSFPTRMNSGLPILYYSENSRCRTTSYRS